MLLADEIALHHPVMSDNPFQPHMARIVHIYKMAENNCLFTLRFIDDRMAHAFRHEPGQFIMLSVPGAGEMPVSFSSSPSRPGVLELCVRVGRVTSALFGSARTTWWGAWAGHNGYPIPQMMGNDILLAAGAGDGACGLSCGMR
jgi:NAD(P)H-flavin reductase